MLVSFVLFVPFFALRLSDSQISVQAILIAVAAGVMNGIGFFILQKMIGTADFQISQWTFIMVLVQIMVSAIGARVFYHEPFGISKWLGIVTALVAVFF